MAWTSASSPARLPYLEATSGLNAGQLSFVVAAVLLGSVISTLFAGMLADWMGRKPLMAAQRRPLCRQHSRHRALARIRAAGLWPAFAGHQRGPDRRRRPALPGGVPAASSRGKGTGIFQWLLTLGIVTAAVVGMYLQHPRRRVSRTGRSSEALRLQRHGLAQHLLGFAAAGNSVRHRQPHGSRVPALAVSRGRRDAAYAALLRSRTRRAGGPRTSRRWSKPQPPKKRNHIDAARK